MLKAGMDTNGGGVMATKIIETVTMTKLKLACRRRKKREGDKLTIRTSTVKEGVSRVKRHDNGLDSFPSSLIASE